jgi:YVTN family beta-propeller protein
VTQINVANNPWGIVATEDAVWVTTNSNNMISKINPQTNQVDATFKVGSGPVGIEFSDNTLWVANEGDNTVWRIKP